MVPSDLLIITVVVKATKTVTILTVIILFQWDRTISVLR